jgi:hypothetical protein
MLEMVENGVVKHAAPSIEAPPFLDYLARKPSHNPFAHPSLFV